jgi:pimeloyl-ACP methyl ester carboxylesterase
MALLGVSVSAPARRRQRAQPPRGEDRLIRLRDGRRLGYAEFGQATGRPVFFFHGMGTTRLICPPAEPAQALGLRLIAVDRPGIGLSDPRPGRRLLDWPADVAELADRLGLGSFAVVGWSGGGPYALATGYALAERVTSLAAVSSPAPLAGNGEAAYLRRFDRNAVRAAGRAPWVIRLALWHWGRPQRRDAVRFLEQSVAAMCESDQQVMADPQLRVRMIQSSAELYRQGGRGLYDEALVLARPWGFRVADLRVPVHLWHGTVDETVPFAMGEHLAEAIPGARFTRFEGEGHHLLYRYWQEILAALE